MSDSDDIVRDFLVESYENLDRLDRDLVGLEKNPKDQAALAGVFRTIKGTCGFLGFNKLEKVAHVGENLLTRLRDGQLTLNPEMTTALLGMVDAVRQMLKEIETTGQDGEMDYPELREALTLLQGGHAVGGSNTGIGPATVSATPPMAVAKKEVEVPVEISTTVPDESTAKSPKKRDPAQSKSTRDKIGSLLVEKGQVPAAAVTLALQKQKQEESDTRKAGEILVSMGLAKPEDVAAAQQVPDSKSRDAVPETIRVGANLLDKLMTLVGELVLARNQLLQVASLSDDTGLAAVSQRMNLIATLVSGGLFVRCLA